MNPLIRPSGFGEWFLLTRYTVKDGYIIAQKRYNVTDQIKEIVDLETAVLRKRLELAESVVEQEGGG